jgi:hypothetical protein
MQNPEELIDGIQLQRIISKYLKPFTAEDVINNVFPGEATTTITLDQFTALKIPSDIYMQIAKPGKLTVTKKELIEYLAYNE